MRGMREVWLFAGGLALAAGVPGLGCAGDDHDSKGATDTSSGGSGGKTSGGLGGDGGTSSGATGGVEGSSNGAGGSGGSDSGGSSAAGGDGSGGSSAAGGDGGVGGQAASGGSSGDSGTSAAGASGAAGSPACTHSEADACDDGNACTDDLCDSEMGCTTKAKDCSDGDTCTLDICSADTGCAHPPLDACVPSLAGCSGRVALFSRAPRMTIPDEGSLADVLEVPPLAGRVWGIVVTTNIEHTWSSDLDVTLTSPQGTVVTLTTDNGLDSYGYGVANAFAGTVWRDNADQSVLSFDFESQAPAPELIPEGALAAFRGEDPSGEWTLEVTDDSYADTGSLVGWALSIATLEQPTSPDTPVAATASPEAAIQSLATLDSSIELSGLGNPVCDVEVTTHLTHSYIGDLEIQLESPEGTLVTLTISSTSQAAVDGFDGTLFSDRAGTPYSDFPFVSGEGADQVVPADSFDRLLGEEGNGTWTLHVTDTSAGDEGLLSAWDLSVTTCACD